MRRRGLLVHAFDVTVPAWEAALLYDAELLGLRIAFVSPWIFAVVLPLTEGRRKEERSRTGSPSIAARS